MNREEYRKKLKKIDSQINNLKKKRADFIKEYQASCSHGSVAEMHNKNVWGEVDTPHFLCLDCGLEEIYIWYPDILRKDHNKLDLKNYNEEFFKLGVRFYHMDHDIPKPKESSW